MAEPYLGQIISVGFNFAPVGWYPCDGRLLDINSYEALFAILGTTYGGNGQTTFGLPNLNGRIPLGQGQGQGLSPAIQGQQFGVENVTLTQSSAPAHTHTISFSNDSATTDSPLPISGTNVAMATDVNTALPGFYVVNKAATVALKSDAITAAGGSQPHENRQQFLVLNYIIAYAGIFPSQN